MEYYKEIEKTDGRILRTGGPRDIQKQQKLNSESSFLIGKLRKEIEDLKIRPVITAKTPEGLFTPEQVDDEIRKSVMDAIVETEKEHKKHIEELAKKLKEAEKKVDALEKGKDSELKVLLEEQNKKIEKLSRLRLNEKGEYEDTDRPKIEEVFIDPLEEDAGEGLIPHIEVEDVSIKRKEDMSQQLDKLKDLYREGLPGKKK